MLENLNEKIHACHEHYGYCALKAGEQANDKLREHYVYLARLWRDLARTYESIEGIGSRLLHRTTTDFRK